MALINNTYFLSKNVKVFPSSFRGRYSSPGDSETYTFDPESRLNTEFNFTHIPGLGGNHSSYIISYDTDTETLKCVIGGYYFEISALALSDLVAVVGGRKTTKKLYIKTREVGLNNENENVDSYRKTVVLNNWDNNSSTDLDRIESNE